MSDYTYDAVLSFPGMEPYKHFKLQIAASNLSQLQEEEMEIFMNTCQGVSD